MVANSARRDGSGRKAPAAVSDRVFHPVAARGVSRRHASTSGGDVCSATSLAVLKGRDYLGKSNAFLARFLST